jgi:hypothetical protein
MAHMRRSRACSLTFCKRKWGGSQPLGAAADELTQVVDFQDYFGYFRFFLKNRP